MAISSRNLWKKVNWMDRDDIVRILEDNGFACHDHETDDNLREALVTNIQDNTIDDSVLDDVAVPERGAHRSPFGPSM